MTSFGRLEGVSGVAVLVVPDPQVALRGLDFAVLNATWKRPEFSDAKQRYLGGWRQEEEGSYVKFRRMMHSMRQRDCVTHRYMRRDYMQPDTHEPVRYQG